jgi:hypothetical protein
MKTNHLLPLSRLAFGLLIAAVSYSATAVVATQNPTTIQVSYSGTVYNLTSKITNYSADSALLQSQPWWGNAGLAIGLAPLVGSQLGNLTSYTPAPPNPYYALFSHELAGSITHIIESAVCTTTAHSCGGPGNSTNFNYVVLGQPLITLSALSSSLSSTSQGVDVALASSALMLNGAHSRPLSRLVATGQKTGWILGDWGRDDHGSRNGSTGLAELGGGYNFGPAQVNVSIGKTWSAQSLPHSGDVDFTGNYLMVEGIVPVSPARGLFATLGAYGHWGEADIRRGYLVSNAQNYSRASPDTQTVGLRARLDWQNAFAWSGAQFSPYTDLSYAETRMDGYTETGGAFPARFNHRTDHATDLRVGLNTSKPIASTTLNFVSNLELAHRFEDRGAATSGTITGLFAFNLAGQEHKRTWMKAGVGVEGQLGAGKASLMLNATSESEMPNVWLAASYQLTF